MSKYTTEVRFICENYAGLMESKGQGSINDIIGKSREKVFDFEYPIYDADYKPVLETKILKHYYTREIGCETVGLWKHFLDMKMNEIMPYYNQLYKSAVIEFNPMYDFDYTTTSNRKIGNNESSTNNVTRTDDLKHHDTTTNSNTSKDKYSDTPQGALTNVENDTYLTNARMVSDSGSVNNDGTNTGTQKSDGTGSREFSSTDEYLEHVAGKRNGTSYSKLLLEYRQTFINIDMQVIEELSGLFMNLW